MASYVQKSLVNGEEIVYKASLSVPAYFMSILVGIILIPLIIGIFILIGIWLTFISTELAVTNRRVIAKFGFIRRRTFELNVDRVEGIQVDQGIIGRIFNFGTLRIGGAGNSDPIPKISNPIKFKKTVMEIQESFRRSFPR